MTEHQTKALLTNFGLKIFHTVGDSETAQYGCSLLGQYRESFVSVSPKEDMSMGEELFGHATMNGNYSEKYEDVLKTSVLLTGLRSGGPPDLEVDGICIKSGEPFRWGQNWQKVAFSQK